MSKSHVARYLPLVSATLVTLVSLGHANQNPCEVSCGGATGTVTPGVTINMGCTGDCSTACATGGAGCCNGGVECFNCNSQGCCDGPAALLVTGEIEVAVSQGCTPRRVFYCEGVIDSSGTYVCGQTCNTGFFNNGATSLTPYPCNDPAGTEKNRYVLTVNDGTGTGANTGCNTCTSVPTTCSRNAI